MAVPADASRSVAEQGFSVVDDFLDATFARTLLEEMRGASPHFRPHMWQFGGAVLPKPGISELDLHDEQAASLTPTFHRFRHEELPAMVTSVCQSLANAGAFPHVIQAKPIDRYVSVKLQRNAGRGAMFPMHHDNAGPPNKRVLTLVIYLNADWAEGDGGEIVFVPFASTMTRVAPLFGRAVIFRSDVTPHYVEPSHKERFCFTVWIDADTANAPEVCNLTTRHLKAGEFHDGSPSSMARFLRHSPLNRSVIRAVYADELRRQLELCLRAADGVPEGHLQAVLAAHTRAVEAQCAHPQLGPIIAALRTEAHKALELVQLEGDRE